MNEDIAKAAETAMKMEQDSIAFYAEAAARSSNRLGRLMFESLVKDEQRHVEGLRHLLAAASPVAASLVPPRGRSFKSAVSTAFSQAMSEMDARVPSGADDLEAVRIAIDLEKAGYSFYRDAAAKAPAGAAKSVYTLLQHEEEEHLDVLQNTFDLLENSGDWFLWEEQGLLDGG